MSQRVNYADAAAYLGIPIGTLRSMVHRKQVPHIRLTAQTIVFDTSELDAWRPTLDTRISSLIGKRGRDLYAVFCTVTRLCKIGRANDPVDRLNDLQIGSPTRLILWCHAPFLGELEGDVHREFLEFRSHGEWFSPEVTARIAADVPLGDVRAWSTFAGTAARRGRGRANREQADGQRAYFEWRGRQRRL